MPVLKSVRHGAVAVFAVVSLVLATARGAGAGPAPHAMTGSFAFPLSLAHGVMGDLVSPAGSVSPLTFAVGRIAVGELPMPLPRRPGRPSRGRRARFVRGDNTGAHARLTLSGVADLQGLVTNTGNQLLIDAIVSPSSAALTPPPFAIAFDIEAGAAFVDVSLPIQYDTGAAVHVQVLGVSVIDPDGQPFGVLGFTLAAAQPTPVPQSTPGPPETEGQCFMGPSCQGASFPASRGGCCHLVGGVATTAPAATSWCPPEQFDASSGRCADDACMPCASPTPADCDQRATCAGPCTVQCPDGQLHAGRCGNDPSCQCVASCEPPATPQPGPCADPASCGSPCAVTCADGTIVAGQCLPSRHGCECSAQCSAPAPCGVGQCFDTITAQCTGQACAPDGRCPAPHQACDLSGRRCPCQLPTPAHGHICCVCPNRAPGCFDFGFVEVQPICPRGCTTFPGQECDPVSGSCVPLAPCASDGQCDDGNPCTVDSCSPEGCTHECVCVGPFGCGPGPAARRPPRR